MLALYVVSNLSNILSANGCTCYILDGLRSLEWLYCFPCISAFIQYLLEATINENVLLQKNKIENDINRIHPSPQQGF